MCKHNEIINVSITNHSKYIITKDKMFHSNKIFHTKNVSHFYFGKIGTEWYKIKKIKVSKAKTISFYYDCDSDHKIVNLIIEEINSSNIC